MAGFEPTTPCPPDKCATRLRYIPIKSLYTTLLKIAIFFSDFSVFRVKFNKEYKKTLTSYVLPYRIRKAETRLLRRKVISFLEPENLVTNLGLGDAGVQSS